MKKLYLLYMLIATTICTQLQAATLTNNYNQATGKITFFPYGATASLASWGNIAIPSGTTSITLAGLLGGGTYTIIPTGSDMNIYQNTGYENNTPYVVTAYSYSTSSSSSLIGSCTISPQQMLPFVTGTKYMSILYNGSTVLSMQSTTKYSSSSYSIVSNSWQWQQYFPSTNNNYTQTITNVNFYDSNPNTSANFISSAGSIPGTTNPNSYYGYTTPFNCSYITGTTTFNGVSSNLTIPALFPTEFFFSNKNSSYSTMTNNTASTVNVTYYGTINSNQTALNNPVISIPPQGKIPNITGCSTINVYSQDGSPFITQAPISPTTSYFINYNATVQTTAVSALTLTNNSNATNQTVSFVTPQGATAYSSLGAWASTIIPTGATQVNVSPALNSGWIGLPLTANTSTNLFTNSIVTNNTTTPLVLSYFVSTTSGIIAGTYINPGQSLPIVSTTGAIQLANASQTIAYATETIAANTSYIINSAGSGFSLTPYTPTLTNNYSQNSTNVNYYDSNNVFVSSPGTITANSFAYTPANAYKVILSELLSTITLQTTFPYQNIFTGSTITNNSNQSIGIIYSGTVNDINNVALNNPAISIATGQTSPIVSNALNISLLDSFGNPVSYITNYQIQPGTPYYITFSNGIWYISSNSTPAQLLNNSNNTVTNVTFYNAANPQVQVGQTVPTLPNNGSTPIPTGAVSCQLTTTLYGTPTNITVGVSDSVNSNICGLGALTNNSNKAVTVNYTGTINNVSGTLMNSTPIAIAAGQYIPIITGASATYVLASGSPVVSNPTTSANTFYFINLIGSSWSITTTPINFYLTNNNNFTANSVVFLDATNAAVSSSTSIAAGSSIKITGIAVTASLNETISDSVTSTTTNIYTPVFGGANSNIFGTGTITNNSATPITITYSGALNAGLGATLNATPITINPGQKIPMITGATSVIVISGSTTVISSPPIDVNTNYYITQSNGAWYISSNPSLAQLVNNSNSAATNVIFKNSATAQVGQTITTLPNNSSAPVPTGAVSCNMTIMYNGTSLDLTIPVSDSTSSNIFESANALLTNNTDVALFIAYQGTVNNVNTLLNYPSIPLAVGQSIRIITGTSQIYAYTIPFTTPVVAQVPALTNTSYFINLIVNTWSITTVPINFYLSNNNGFSTSSINYYDIINALVGVYAPIVAGSSGPIAGTAVTALLYETISDSVTSTATNMYVPVSGGANSNIFTTGTITNNAATPVTVTYFGPLNAGLGTTLNATQITINPGQQIPIITSATSITVYSASSAVITSATLQANTSYFINYSGTAWSLDLFASSSILSNNSTQTATNIIFYNTGPTQVGTTITTLAAGSHTLIPSSAVSCTMTIYGTNIKLPVSNTVSSNIFGSGKVTNNSDAAVTVNYTGTINSIPNTPMNTTPIALGVGQYIPIIAGASATYVLKSGSPVVNNPATSPNAFYFINLIGSSWSITNNPINFYLTNNNNFDANSVVFLDTTNTAVSSSTTISAGSSGPIAGTAVTASLTQTISDSITSTTTNMYVPVAGGADSNIFTTATITNNAATPVTVTYFGPLNSGLGTTLNATRITINPGQQIPIITGATSITVYSASTAVITSATLLTNTNYFINYSGIAWSLDLFPSSSILSNNSTSTATNIVFKNSGPTQVGATIATLPAGSHTLIPASAVSCTMTIYGTNITLPVSNTASSNIFGSGKVTNSSDTAVTVNYTGTINGIPNTPMNSSPISVGVDQFIPIITGTSITTYVLKSGSPVVNNPSTSINSPYFINLIGSSWSITNNPIDFYLNNNNNFDANNVTFLDATNTAVSSSTTITAGSSGIIAGTAVTASLRETISDSVTSTTTNMYVPVSGGANSNIFSTNTITNNAATPVAVTYFGPLNSGLGTTLNATRITINPGQQIPIITDATSISVYSGSSAVITFATLLTNTNYFINYSGTAWSLDLFASSSTLSNNSTSSATNLIFKNGPTQVGTTITTLPAGSHTLIPANAVSCTMTIYGTNITLPVSNTASSNIFGSGKVTNSSDTAVTVNYTGTINGIPNTLMNSSPISVGVDQYIPIIAGTSITTYVLKAGSPVVNNPSTSADTFYFINLIGTAWSITNSPIDFYLSNNNNFDANNVIFLNANNAAVSSSTTIPAGSSGIIAGTAVTTLLTQTISDTVTSTTTNMYVPVSGGADSNIFTTATITNNAATPVTVTYFGPLNSGLGTTLNATQITINPGQQIPIITNTTSMTVYSASTAVISAATINTDTSYFINNSGSAWGLGSFPASSILSNNSTQTATNLIFYNTGSTQVGTTIATLSAGSRTAIPTSAVSCTMTIYSTNIKLPVSNAVSSNIFGSGKVTNNSDTAVTVNYTGTINGVPNELMNMSPIPVGVGQFIPIITGTSLTTYVLKSGSPVVNNPSTSPNSPYFINLIGSSWSITNNPINFYLTNNNNFDANNVVFLDTTNTAVSSSTTIPAGSSGSIAGTAVTASLRETISDTVTSTTTNMYVPVSGGADSNIFTTGTITNNAATPVTVTYFGPLNSGLGTTLNTTRITINPGQQIPVMTGATSITVYSASTTVITSATLLTNTNYFINYSGVAWSLNLFASSSILSNNSTSTATNVIFYNTGPTQVGTTIITLPAGGHTAIPASAVSCTMTIYGTNIKLPVSNTVSSNIFGSGKVTNNSDAAVTVNYTGTINGIPNTPMNTTPIALGVGQYIPIITGTSLTTYVLKSGSPVVNNPATSPNAFYFINLIGSSWSITNNPIDFYLNNNNNFDANSVVFLDTTNTAVSSSTTISAGSSGPIAGTALTASLTQTISDSITSTTTNMYVPVSGGANSNIFSSNTITNNAATPVTVTYFGPLNSGLGTTLNATRITINPGQQIPIITDATSITVYSGSSAVITSATLLTSTNYFINYSGIAWSLDLFASSSILSNNSTQAATNVIFYNTVPTQVGTTITTLPAGSHTLIPASAVSCTMTIYATNIKLPVSNTVSSNIFGSGKVTNNSDTAVTVNYTGTINSVPNTPMNSTPIALGVGQYIPIIAGTSITTYVLKSGSPVVNNPSTLINSPYFINLIGSSWSITNNPIDFYLNNNNNFDANNVTFLDTTNTAVSSSTTIAAGSYETIAGTAVTASLRETISDSVTSTTTNMYVPVSGGINSNIFSTNTISNNATTPVTVTYFGPLNSGLGTTLNTTQITINPGKQIPIIVGATSITVYSASSAVVTAATIAPNTNYFVNNFGTEWNVDSFAASSQLLNNSTIAATHVIFYDTTDTQIGSTIATLSAGNSASIPAGAVSCQLTIFSIRIILAVSNTVSSNIFGSGFITNNTNTTVTINYKGLINNVPDTLINNTPIPLTAGQSMPIITGASITYVLVSGSPVTNNPSTSANTSYFINLIDTIWSITTAPIAFYLTNNNSFTANNVIFYNTSNTAITIATSIVAGFSQLISGTAVKASLNETISDSITSTTTNISVPVSGGADSNIFTTATITNNAATALTLSYFGTLNSVPNSTLNTTKITVNPGQKIPMITGTTSIIVYSGMTAVISNTSINAATNYYITQSNGAWYLASNPSLAQLLNNSNNAATNLIFYNAANSQVGQTITTLASNNSASIPTGAVSCQLTTTLHSVSLQITVGVSDSINSNIFGLGVLTNNSEKTVTINYTGIINDASNVLMNSIPITLGVNQYIPIITGVSETYVLAAGSPVVNNLSTSSNVSYFINLIVNTWSITTKPINYYITNNNNFAANSVIFLDATNTAISSSTSIAAQSSGSIAGTAVTASLNEIISDTMTSTTTNIYTPVSGGADSTIFSIGSITNNAATPVTITYSGPLNSGLGTTLNTTRITINPGLSIPMITGTTSITVYSGSSAVISTVPLTTNTNYFINYIGGQWTISSLAATYALINNYNQATGAITFKDSSGTTLSTSDALIPWGFAQIPTTATVATFTDLLHTVNTTLTIPVFGSTTSSNIFSNYVLTNNYVHTIEVTYYGTINGVAMTQLNSLAIPLEVGQSMQIPTNTTHVSATSTPGSLTTTSITATTSYIITNSSGAVAIAPYTPMLVNNGSENATNLNFYQSNGSAILPQYATFTIGSSNTVPVPGNATFVSILYASSTITIDTSFATTSNYFTTSTITNNSEQSIFINFYGPINGNSDALMNNSPIIILAGNCMQTVTGATSIEIIVGNQIVIEQTTLTSDTSYFINQNNNAIPQWTITTTIPLSNSYLYNNSTSSGSGLIFYTDVNSPIGVPTSISSYGQVQIPLNASTAQLQELATNLVIPVTESVDITDIFTNFVITNETPQTISVSFYGTINGTTTLLNNPDFTASTNASIAIFTGATAITVKINGTTVIPLSQGTISTSSSYFVLYDGINNVYYLSPSTSPLNVILVNNYQEDATSLTFYDIDNNPIAPGPVSFPAFDAASVPSAAVRATLIDFNDITLDIPIQSFVNTDLFSAQVIANNSVVTIGIIFYNSLGAALNTTPIQVLAGASIPIITDTQYVSVYNAIGTITNINRESISPNNSYYITNNSTTWYLNQYTTSALLTNNYSLAATNLNFYSATDIVDPLIPTQNQFPAFGLAGIPSTATTASFTEIFNTISSDVTIPISAQASSNIYIPCAIYNTTTSTVGITYYGTVNGTPNTPLNSVPFSIAPIHGTTQNSVPILTNTQYITVTVDGIVVINTSAMNLPLIISYDVNFIAGVWYITPRILTLTNNSNQFVRAIRFYDSSGDIIEIGSTLFMRPWSTLPIPTIATTAITEFDATTITLPLSTQAPSKIFTNNLLINNSQDTVSIIFYGTIGGIQNSPLNDSPFVLAPGQSTPFITQTLSMSMTTDGQTISSNYQISSNGSYGINPTTGYGLTRAVGSIPEVSSSTLGVIRFLGGEVQPNPSILSVDMYGQNSNIFEEFLYINFYLQVITNNTARAATLHAINRVFNTYGNDYSMQQNFNYITNANLINPTLLATQQILIRQYPGSATQITKFFILLQNRINLLAA